MGNFYFKLSGVVASINNPKSKIQDPKSNWRRRVGVEPTQDCSHNLTNDFEDRAHHRTRCASAKNVQSNRKILEKICQVKRSGKNAKRQKRECQSLDFLHASSRSRFCRWFSIITLVLFNYFVPLFHRCIRRNFPAWPLKSARDILSILNFVGFSDNI